MTKKTKQKKKKSNTNKHLPLLLTLFLVSVFALFMSLKQQDDKVLASKSFLADKSENKKVEQVEDGNENEDTEKHEEQEPTEAEEPTEVPESKKNKEKDELLEENEQKVEDIHDDVKYEVDNGAIENIEVKPDSTDDNKGTVIIERTNGTTREEAAPVSHASLIDIQSTKAGKVSVSVGDNGTVTLTNNGVVVQTEYPIVIDPKTNSIAIKTPSGITVVNTLPSEAMSKTNQIQGSSVIQSTTLDIDNGKAYYKITGIQNRKFIGIVPVKATIHTKINAENGDVESTEKPWFLKYLGILYTS